jgi:Uma2 family endonuclease
MATARTLLTAEEFFRTGPETDGCELVRGEVVRMPPPGDRHGEVCASVIFVLKSYTRSVGHGTVLGNDAGLITRRDPDSVRGVDAALFLRPSWQGQPAPAGYTHEAPDLVVEVRSREQRWKDVLDKVTEYLGMGARLVWVIDPQSQRVTVFGPDQEPRTFAPENELEGGDVLPGFRCRVADFFT